MTLAAALQGDQGAPKNHAGLLHLRSGVGILPRLPALVVCGMSLRRGGNECVEAVKERKRR